MTPGEIEALRALVLEVEGDQPSQAADVSAFDLRSYLAAHGDKIGELIAAAAPQSTY